MFLNSNHVANNKLPSYKRKTSPINQNYLEQLYKLEKDKKYSHTNRLSKINQLIKSSQNVQVIKNNYNNKNNQNKTISEDKVTNNSGLQQTNVNPTNQDDDIPESLKILQKKKRIFTTTKKERDGKNNKEKN